MRYIVSFFAVLIFSALVPLWAQEENKEESNTHGKGESSHQHDDHGSDGKPGDHAHEAEETHAHDAGEKHERDHSDSKDSHGHEEEGREEAGGNTGPDKGILEANEKQGFRLSPEALKNFEIRTLKTENSGPWTLPLSARLLSLEEVNLYRLRDGHFKRIDFNVVKSGQGQMTITSSELQSGDEIAIHGIGFLRIAELAAFGGVAHGHSH